MLGGCGSGTSQRLATPDPGGTQLRGDTGQRSQKVLCVAGTASQFAVKRAYRCKTLYFILE